MNKTKAERNFNKIEKVINNNISWFVDNKENYVNKPGIDFTRNRKLSMNETIYYVIFNNGSSMPLNMCNLFNFKKDKVPWPSALIQQRDKIKTTLYKDLFNRITKNLYEIKNKHKTYLGYYLFAIDGTDVNVCYNKDEETHVKPNLYKVNGEQYKGFNQIHLNAVYDVLNKLYIDTVLQPKPQYNERIALLDIVKDTVSITQDFEDVIFIGDRGYYSVDMIANFHILGKNFIFRIKKNNQFVKDLPNENIDITKKIEFTPKGKKVKKSTGTILRLSKDTILNFDKVGISMDIRILKFKLPNGDYEYLVTNVLDPKLKINNFKEIYRLRWEIETSFRTLKYVVGILYTSSKKTEFIEQELYGKLTLFNVCEALITEVEPLNSKRKINNRLGIAFSIKFLLGMLDEQSTIDWISRTTIPIIPFRLYQRRENHKKRFASFMYRKIW